MLGLLDDLLIVPAGIWLVIRLIPEALMAEFRHRAAALAERPRSLAGLVLVLAIWAIVAALVALAVMRAG